MGQLPPRTYHHFLIGLPASGKSTLARQLLQQFPDSCLISPDAIRAELYGDPNIQGNWSKIETRTLEQARIAFTKQQTIIYDATNAKRTYRFNWLQKVQQQDDRPLQWIGWWLDIDPDTCIKRNQSRDRQVPTAVIEEMAADLKTFKPTEGEGFVKIYRLKPKDLEKLTPAAIAQKTKSVDLTITRRQSRKSKQIPHRYSHLLDFERLLFTLHFLLHQKESPPAPLGERGEQSDIVEAIHHHLKENHGGIYGDRPSIEQDLIWLEANDLFQCQPSTKALTFPEISPDKLQYLQASNYPGHRYDDWQPFERVMLIFRTILQHPFIGERDEFQREQDHQTCPKPSRNKSLSVPFQAQSLEATLNELGILGGKLRSQIRHDIQDIFKPYGLMKSIPYKKGYYLGTAILSSAELQRLREALHGNQVYLNDTNISDLLDSFEQRLQQGGIELREQAIRAIGNRDMVDLEKLPERCLLRPEPLQRLDIAIRENQLWQFAYYPKTASWSGHPQERFAAYPLQLLFFNKAWYLGYERQDQDLLWFERMDRLRFESLKPLGTRSAEEQQRAIKRLRKLHEATPGVYLGRSAADQKRYLLRNKLSKKDRETLETTVEIWMNDWSFRFMKEGLQRFGKGQMQLSKEVNKNYSAEEAKIFTIADQGDEAFPYIMRLKLPKWSVGSYDPTTGELVMGDIEFLRWILGYRGKLKVTKPESFVALIRKEISEMAALYGE